MTKLFAVILVVFAVALSSTPVVAAGVQTRWIGTPLPGVIFTAQHTWEDGLSVLVGNYAAGNLRGVLIVTGTYQDGTGVTRDFNLTRMVTTRYHSGYSCSWMGVLRHALVDLTVTLECDPKP